MNKNRYLNFLILFAMTPPVWATNGMNLEGYGPIATGNGGAGLAYDNGTAATMNNPATLSLMPENHRADLAMGALQPNITATVNGPGGLVDAESDANFFLMPALGWAARSGGLTYGFGVFSQGGMGTTYAADTWMADPSGGQNTALTQGLVNKSEVGVGRFILPLSYQVAPNIAVGGSLDFIWAGMDLRMGMSEGQFQNLANPAAQNIGNASGSLVQGFGTMYEPFGGAGISRLYHAYFDFADTSPYTGEAKSTGFGGKLGVVFKLSDSFSLGATYHSQSSLSDMESSNAALSMAVNIDPTIVGQPAGPNIDANITLSGKIKVVDFQWPAMYGIGAAYKVTDKFMLVGDIKQVAWSQVMDSFRMEFSADNVATNGNFAGAKLNAELYQEWEDQTVFALGGVFQGTEALALRFGYNRGDNPVPNEFMNPLFPATIEEHYTMGASYQITKSQSFHFSFVGTERVKATNPGVGATIPPITTKHEQVNYQLMYSWTY